MSDTPVTTADSPDSAAPGDSAVLVLDLDGYGGPIDMLLSLAREQKVDLTRISILALADQYLAFIAAARRLRLELAADYLVMAAWLAYLKSRLLLPEPVDEQPSGEELAAALAFQLRRLEAMQAAAAQLMARPRLGLDVFARGAPEGIAITKRPVFSATLYDLLKAYAEHKREQDPIGLSFVPTGLVSLEEALVRLRFTLGQIPDWTVLSSFLPSLAGTGPLVRRSVMAAHFAASLELAKAGDIELRQDGAFAPIFLRRRVGAVAEPADDMAASPPSVQQEN
ncbi:MAG: ScpA family protein [Azospirillaceae bacterium]|nr:ScpA family protein [Azospirillaceae bacterium]